VDDLVSDAVAEAMPNTTLGTVHAEPQIIPTGRHPGETPRVWLEALAVAALASTVFVVHPFGYVMHHSYWGDEAWVAVLSKAPLTRLVSLSSSTPIGWLLAVRWAPVGRDGLRMVPLLFAAGVVVMAYVVARCLPWKNASVGRFAGAVAGVVVLLAPISLMRNDLKQYTSDAFFTLVVIALACRVGAEPGRRNLTYLVVGSAVSIVFSTAAAFVVVAVFAGLAITALATRTARRIVEVALAGGATAVVLSAYFALVVLPHDNQALRDYWRPYYLSEHGFQVLSVAWQRLDALQHALAIPAVLLIALNIVGMIVLAGFGRSAVALAAPILWAEMLTAGVTKRYPFLDQRTSHFLLILSCTLASIGFVGIVTAAASRSRVLATLLIVGAAAGFLHGAEPYIRIRSIPNEDVRSQVLFVAKHYQHGDVVLVSYMSDWGFDYYWPGGDRRYSVDHSGRNSNGFFTHLADRPDVVYAQGRTGADTTEAMRRALALTRSSLATGRIWLIRTHVSTGEKHAWDDTLSAFGLIPSYVPVGTEPLVRVDANIPVG
jgi:hypothetical protein